MLKHDGMTSAKMGNTYISENERVRVVVVNIAKQCPPVFLIQLDLKQGKLPRSEEGKMMKSGSV